MTTANLRPVIADWAALPDDQLAALHAQLHAELDRRGIAREDAEAAERERRRAYWTRRRDFALVVRDVLGKGVTVKTWQAPGRDGEVRMYIASDPEPGRKFGTDLVFHVTGGHQPPMTLTGARVDGWRNLTREERFARATRLEEACRELWRHATWVSFHVDNAAAWDGTV